MSDTTEKKECEICFEEDVDNRNLCKTEQCNHIVCDTCTLSLMSKGRCPFCMIDYKYEARYIVNHPIPKDILLSESCERYEEEIPDFGYIVWQWYIRRRCVCHDGEGAKYLGTIICDCEMQVDHYIINKSIWTRKMAL